MDMWLDQNGTFVVGPDDEWDEDDEDYSYEEWDDDWDDDDEWDDDWDDDDDEWDEDDDDWDEDY